MDNPHPLEIAQEHGAALLDNTTVTGATAALDELSNASIADEQSLADLLEAVVLHESLVIDSWADTELYPQALLNAGWFDTFPSVTAVPRRGTPAVVDHGLLVFTTCLVREALDRLERALRSGGLARQYEFLTEKLGADQNFSPLYARERDLRGEIIDLYRTETFELPPTLDQAAFGPILACEDAISKALSGASEGHRLYAMFLLRAFYYEELAAAFSISYVPHTFRAQALFALPRERGGPSTGAFGTYVRDLAGAARGELGRELEQEFGFEVTVDVPPIASRIARDVESRSGLLPAALELRDSESARDFRRWVRDQELLLQRQRDPPAIRTAMNELNEVVANLRVELLGAKAEGGHPITIKGSAGVPPFATIEISTERTVRAPAWLRRGPSWLQRALPRRRPYLTFFSQLARDQVGGRVAPFGARLRELPP